MIEDPYKPPTASVETPAGGAATRSYNNALVLIRFLAFYFMITGALGFVYIACAVLAQAAGAPEWLMNPPLYFAAQGIFGNPIYLLGGFALLGWSRSVARLITKYCEPENAA